MDAKTRFYYVPPEEALARLGIPFRVLDIIGNRVPWYRHLVKKNRRYTLEALNRLKAKLDQDLASPSSWVNEILANLPADDLKQRECNDRWGALLGSALDQTLEKRMRRAGFLVSC
jgi:hypothetical protein